jgi:predicted Zn-dependent peptidase
LLSCNPAVKPEGLPEREYREGDGRVQVGQLPNGITVISESTREPGTVSLAVSLDLGTRDESD